MSNALQKININSYEPKLKRKFFTEEELAKIPVERLRQYGFLPAAPGPVDIEKFAECVSDFSYSLDLPQEIDGMTVFSLEGLPKVLVADRLTRDEGCLCYLRSTIAHECSHVIVHNPCFREAYMEAVQGTVPPGRAVAYLRTGSEYKWYEWQANRIAAGLLMPYTLVIQVYRELIATLPNRNRPWQPVDKGALEYYLAKELQVTFEVSQSMARIHAEQFLARNSAYAERDLSRIRRAVIR